MDFGTSGQLLIIYSTFVEYLRKKLEYSKAVYQLVIDLMKAYDSVRKEVLYNVPIQFGVAMKLVKLMKMLIRWVSIPLCIY
jgi:hypothetical protein